MGCRTFFCDPSVQDRSAGVYESAHQSIRRLHDQHGIPYHYVELTAGLYRFMLAAEPALLSKKKAANEAYQRLVHSAEQLYAEFKRRGWEIKETAACAITFDELDTVREREPMYDTWMPTTTTMVYVIIAVSADLDLYAVVVAGILLMQMVMVYATTSV